MKFNKINQKKIQHYIFRETNTYRKDFCEYPNLWNGDTRRKSNIFKKIKAITANKQKLLIDEINKNKEKNILLYAHFPFCSTNCLFCNVPGLMMPDQKKSHQYIEYLKRELKLYLEKTNVGQRNIKAIYFGGGTPVEADLPSLLLFIKYIQKHLKIDKDYDFTVEVHPKIIVSKSGDNILKSLKKYGVNRISMGVQSFDNEVLKFNHRCHNQKQAIDAYKKIKTYGFLTNIDMMYGLPGQTFESVEADLQILNKLLPDSIECFRLEHVNPKIESLDVSNPKIFPSDKTIFNEAILVNDWLVDHHYQQNGFLDNSYRNYLYRTYTLNGIPNLGLGKSAASHWGNLRTGNLPLIEYYFEKIDKNQLPVDRYFVLTDLDQAIRYLFLRIQTKNGINLKEFQDIFKFPVSKYFSKFFKNLEKLLLINQTKKNIRLTKIGSYFTSDIVRMLIEYSKSFWK